MSEKVPKQVLEELLRMVDSTPVEIVRALTGAGYEAYIVGGAVRDLLLGKVPKDYDISTSATPEEVRKVFGRRRCHVIGRRFRLAHVYGNGEIYEVSTFRRTPNEKERQGKKHEDGPIIWNDNCFGNLEEDARRRDFTVNALYLDVSGKRGVIDFSGGYGDLKAGIVRCIGEPRERMGEDPVRMLRALKLVGQCGFRLEPSLEAAIRSMASEIRCASPARLFEELLKLLANPDCGKDLAVMHETGFLAYFWPVVEDAWEEPVGEMMRHLLKLRGEAIRRGRYSNSRGLALSTVALPYLMLALNPENPVGFWEGNAAAEPIAHQALALLFEGVSLPRLLSQRVLQIVGLVPRLMKKPVAMRYLNHAEYRYGRALVALLVQLFGWDNALLADLPEFSPKYGPCDDLEDGEDGVFWLESAPEENTEGAATAAIPEVQPLVPEEAPAFSTERAEEAEAPQPEKRKRRRSSSRKTKHDNASSESAPENSPALHIAPDAPLQEESPVVEAPPAPPAAAFFNPVLPDSVKKTSSRKHPRKSGSATDSITFG